MQRLPSIIGILLLSLKLISAQSPHGESLTIDCKKCHTSDSWSYNSQGATFTHDSTSFILKGQHQSLNCKSCHSSLKFNEAKSDCNSCHVDVHNQTVGLDCKRCHSEKTWIVENIRELHERTSFPLTGVHSSVNCTLCHKSETNIRFNTAGNQCIDCHQADYNKTTAPNHRSNKFSENCIDCHNLNESDWHTNKINHDFFPLHLGHAIKDCKQCHTSSNYSGLSKECITCHKSDFASTINPNHTAAQFKTDCANCHTLNPGWKPAEFLNHDGVFPIYSGKHKSKWISCQDCHKDQQNFKSFTCIRCHLNPETDVFHKKVDFYLYQDQACLACHPSGSADEIFNHNNTQFPLTGSHTNVDCKLCHLSTYKGTSSDCFSCHSNDYNNSKNPDHKKIGLSTDCKSCHNTSPNWSPSKFDIHDQYYPLRGAHKIIAFDCNKCHNGNYTTTPNTCANCHQADYDQTKNPNHKTAQFPNDCASCHSENAWLPSTFNHDGLYFPIFSGKHKSVWMECKECHNIPSDFKQFTCISCHKSPETNQAHNNVPGYNYLDNACLACHPTGDADFKFDHNSTKFPLTGAHLSVSCQECHQKTYKGTSGNCVDCHQLNFDQAKNPDHKKLSFSNECAQCHTTSPGWSPAKFDNHNAYYVLKGAHVRIANDCKKCHVTNYNSTPNTCAGCHQSDFDKVRDPDHQKSGFTNECATCHNENAWVPSTFNHDGLYFPIYSGKHKNTWSQCISCHTNSSDLKQFNCLTCHLNPETDQKHTGVNSYIYDNQACFACHPSGDASQKFDHNATSFPLTGAHQMVNCIECHKGKFKGTSSICADCHQKDFDQSLNPNHKKLGISNDCSSCHSTNPGWSPASFNIHNSFYILRDAHAAVAKDCKVCHSGNYINTPNTCFGCHGKDYNNTKNPNHQLAQFPTDCANCHSEKAWNPTNFNHDGQYFPIYSGKHKSVWLECKECHSNPSDFKSYNCISCHKNPPTDDKHKMVNGYVYQSNACFACHPTGDASFKFDHNTTNFPLNGAHQTVECIKCHSKGFKGTSTLCVDCHQVDFNLSKNPSHIKLGISTDCISCHTTNPGWSPAKFNIHDNFFRLDGGHKPIADNCNKCHNGNYNNLPSNCDACHQNDYNRTTNPNHNKLKLSNDCSSCHTTIPGWKPATFDIHVNYYPIKGAHIKIAKDCASCHKGDYNNTPNTCVGCHKSDYDKTLNPNHLIAQFNNDCASCHSESGWQPSTFPHDMMYFPIYSGKHKPVWNKCLDCHKNPTDFKKFQCVDCHLKPVTDDDHKNIGGYLYQDFACLGCHPTGDKKMSFNHDASNFPLTGAHHNVDCKSCHANGFKNTPTDCKSCHLKDYNSSQNPNHKKLNLPTDCSSCHTTDPGWAPAKFDIHNNYWIIDGAHTAIFNNCKSCHVGGNYSNTPNTCVSCHLKDYNSSTNPNHKNLNIPNDCISCHTTAPGWTPATFSIHNNYWVFEGAHIAIKNDCIQCHHGNYNNTPNTCYGCHKSDYDKTTKPSHKSANFPTSCTSCHQQGAWIPSTWDHDNQYFPIYKGKHKDEWNSCSDCHTNSNNYTIFNCLGCHKKSETDSNHNGVNGYSYTNSACYSCHPDGKK